MKIRFSELRAIIVEALNVVDWEEEKKKNRLQVSIAEQLIEMYPILKKIESSLMHSYSFMTGPGIDADVTPIDVTKMYQILLTDELAKSLWNVYVSNNQRELHVSRVEDQDKKANQTSN